MNDVGFASKMHHRNLKVSDRFEADQSALDAHLHALRISGLGLITIQLTREDPHSVMDSCATA